MDSVFSLGSDQSDPTLDLVDAADAEVVSLVEALRDPASRPRHIALIGTFAPRKCGIATFTSDVFEQLRAFYPDIRVDVYAIDDPANPLAYDGIAGTIVADRREDYISAARAINESGAEAVWVQHEYGIFGGADGVMVRELTDRVAAPLVLTLHTVLSAPSESQRAILEHLTGRASRIMVMSRHGRNLLVERYRVAGEVIDIIAHGAPDRPAGREAEFKARLGLAGRDVLMTFGLIGLGKGIERMIEALPEVVARHPNVIYRIVGATHPALVARDGEAYRDGLVALAGKLGVSAHVAFENRFLDTPELLDQLEACDIYVTPYFNLQQSTSGTLSYAVALGKAVVSTPYVHAAELLADGIGVLIEPNSAEALARAVNGLLDDRTELAAVKARAYAMGRRTIWPQFARASAELLRRAAAPAAKEMPLSALPGLSAVWAMSDATGMLQHGVGIIADRRHGYCLDDNARALMLVNVAEGISVPDRLRWSSIYAAFIQDAWNPDLKRFRNFMRFDRSWCEDFGSEDSNGRALWTLGQTIERAPDPDIRRWAMRLYDQVHPSFAEIDSPRALGFAMLGAAAVERAVGTHAPSHAILQRGGEMLYALLCASRRPDWAWFEAVLGYDNPRLSQALIEAGTHCGRSEWTAAGMETLAWVCAMQTASSGHFRPVGSETFGQTHAAMPFDQQPLEAQAAIEAARTAFAATGETWAVDHAIKAYRWFFGANDRGVVLADVASGRCRDGVTPRGVNENCGAESILAFQLGHYALMALLAESGTSDAAGCSGTSRGTLGDRFGLQSHTARRATAYP